MGHSVQLFLARQADAAWREVIRPWLEAGHGRLERAHVVVPTRGQAHALKQRCLVEGVRLLGVEFLTPGLARQKWRAVAASGERVLEPELLLLGLRTLLERRLAALTPDDSAWGLWKSLQSDPERALEAFEDLLRAGFRAEDFPLAPLREVFSEVTEWSRRLGYELAAPQAERFALTPLPDDAPRVGGRLLVHGFDAEAWPEFFNVAALARRCEGVAVILPAPELHGARAFDEAWIDLWEKFLGVEPRMIDAAEPRSCGELGTLWVSSRGSAVRARTIVGHTRADEMELVAETLAQLLARGAENIGVIFPRADAAHLRLMRLLAARGVPFANLLETSGGLSIDGQIQRALLSFHARGARLEELLALWPLLRALDFVRASPGAARDICERLFDEAQTHAVAAYLPRLDADERPAWREIGRIARLLLPAWPDELALADALARCESLWARFHLSPPGRWEELRRFAQEETSLLPARVVCATIEELLPDAAPASEMPGRGVFARVTLTTRRRATAVAWSHLVFVESNAGVWPERQEPSVWLPDDQRRALNARGRFSLGLFTSDDRAALEKQAWGALVRDTREQVIFSAALFDEEEPELRLAPNAWLERVLIAHGAVDHDAGGMEDAFAQLAREAPSRETAAGVAPQWFEIWQRRRDPWSAFDEFFLSGPPELVRPPALAARLIERAIADPAELWFEAVLGVRRVAWAPLVRARKKSLGTLAHRLLASALRGAAAEGIFRQRPTFEAARHELAATLERWRASWPHDYYWDSFHGELAALATTLLEKVFTLRGGDFVAVEAKLPQGATIPLGGDERLAVHGRMDLVLSDRPEWGGATIEVVDFKTGSDARLSSERMARGASLQLGVYLAAAESLGIADGRVWMVKPDAAEMTPLSLAELPEALQALGRLRQHFATGRCGALTPDRTEFSRGFEWPLACTPVRHAVLREKFIRSFGVAEVLAESLAAQ